jgi:hypothetical protein
VRVNVAHRLRLTKEPTNDPGDLTDGHYDRLLETKSEE